MEKSVNATWADSMDIPIDLRRFSPSQEVFRYVGVILGSLLNALVPLTIGFSRQLHYPRHVFWAGICCANEMYIIGQLSELLAVLHGDRIACQIFVLLAGSNYSSLLMFLVLAALDRYLAVAHFKWYKEKVTNQWVVCILITTLVLTYCVITSPFWLRFKSIKTCTVNLTHMHWVLVYDCVLGLICVFLYVITYIRSRQVIRQHSSIFSRNPVALRFLPNPLQDSFAANGNSKRCSWDWKLSLTHRVSIRHNFKKDIENIEEYIFLCYPGRAQCAKVDTAINCEPREDHKDAVVESAQHWLHQNLESESSDTTDCFPWLQSHIKLSRLEVRAALNMSVSVLPVCLCTFPVTLNAIAIYWCIRLQRNCALLFGINPYFHDLFLIQAIYNPLMYMWRSAEFWRAVSHSLQKCKLSFNNWCKHLRKFIKLMEITVLTSYAGTRYWRLFNENKKGI